MAMKRLVTYVELNNGAELGPYRVTHRHRARWDKTIKARGLEPESVEADKILGWIVSSSAEDSPLSGLRLNEWEAEIFDVTNQHAEPDEARRNVDEDGDELDPTPPAH